MNKKPTILLLLAASLLLTPIASSAAAVTYRFLGECTDGCDGLVTARISFSQEYMNTLGEKADQVVRFDYESSNVSISLTEQQIFDSVIQGSFFSSIPFSSPVPEEFTAGGSPVFETSLDSSWLFQCDVALCGSIVNDMGTGGIWQITSIPVPGAVWLLGSALVGLFGTARLRSPR
ncbi:MAG: hypothetical protein AAFN78_16625 [Pseudomonadota bacterium]